MESQGKEYIQPWIDTREVQGAAVVYSETLYILNKIVDMLKEREMFIIQRNKEYRMHQLLNTSLKDPTPTPDEAEAEMMMIQDEINKEIRQNFEQSPAYQEQEAFNIYQDIEQEHEVWENCTKFGCEHKLPLYDEETNPYGVYLYLNDCTLKDVFPNTHLVVQ